MLFDSLADREVSYFLTEGISPADRNVSVNGEGQGYVSGIDQVLILLVNHLVQDFGEAGSCKKDLSHHHDVLTDDNNSVKLIWDKWKVLFIVARTFFVNDKNSESIVITVHQNCVGHFNPNKLRYICHLLSFQLHLLDHMIGILFVKVADVEALLSEDLVAKLGEPLVKAERFDLAILFGVLVGNLVRTLRSEPLVSPFVQVQVPMRITFVVPSLKR